MAGGAEVALCASNPLSTQDDVAASLVEDFGVPVFARNGEDKDLYYSHLLSVLDREPDITMDDGAELVSVIHKKRPELIDKMRGGTEETTTGAARLKLESLNIALDDLTPEQEKYLDSWEEGR